MIATERALEAIILKLTVLPVSVRIHSDSRHALQQLRMGPAHQNDSLDVTYGKAYISVSSKNIQNAICLMSMLKVKKTGLSRKAAIRVRAPQARGSRRVKKSKGAVHKFWARATKFDKVTHGE